jgi:hypothetical protein
MVAGNEPGDEALLEQVRALVRQLDAKELQQREAAESALLELGSRVVELLPVGETKLSAEVHERLSRVRQRLLQVRAEQHVAGSQITLRAQRSPLGQVLAELEKQSGNPLVAAWEQAERPGAEISVDASLDGVPFWMALDEVLDQVELTTYDYQEGLTLVPRPPGQRPRKDQGAYVGAFRIEARQLEARRNLLQADSGALAVRLGIQWEPRLAPIAIKLLEDVVAEDEQGNRIPPAPSAGEIEALVTPRSTSTEMDVMLALPRRGAERIAKLQSELAVMVPGGIETFELGELPQSKNRLEKRAGVELMLEETRKNNELSEVRIRVRFPAAEPALESHRGWVFDNEAYLLDAEGMRREHDGFQTTLQTEDEVGVAYLFDIASLEGCQFVYKTPAVILEVPVTFELKDLPLP